MQTLASMKIELWHTLRQGGVEDAHWEIRQMVCHTTGLTTEQYVAQSSMYLNDSTVGTLRDMADKRAKGMPLAYLFGEWDFYGLRFIVNKNVLIPRADTELLCRVALGLTAEGNRVLDLCCGCGCLGLTIARHHPDATVVLADISKAALMVAEQNHKLIAPKGFVIFVPADALNPPPEQLGRFNIIVCNPPYISEDEWSCLPPSVREYEPKIALLGGEDGLDFYRSLAKDWHTALRPRGVLCLEIGWTQADAVCDLLREHSFREIKVFNDTMDIRRVITARKAAV